MRSLFPAVLILSLGLAGCAAEGSKRSGGDPGAVTRTLTAEVAPGEGPLLIENLAGSLTVTAATGDAIEAVATIHSSSEDLAALVTLEETRGEKGERILRVAFPVSEHRTYRYGKPDATGSNWLNLLGAGDSTTGFPYAGVKVEVARGRGVPLYADLEVRVPATGPAVSFFLGVGRAEARDVDGTLEFLTYEGDQSFEGLSGKLTAEVGSGTMKITGQRGILECQASSGSVVIQEFEGSELSCTTASGDVELSGASSESLELQTASGDVTVADATARLLKASTASGDVHVDRARVDEFDAGTASGDIWLSADGARLKKIDVGTAHGEVTLLLGDSAAFELKADVGHGKIENGFDDAEPIRDGEDLLGYRRGDGRTQIDVRMTHGSLVIAPGRPPKS